MTQKTGSLIFDETADRYDIRFDVTDYYRGRGRPHTEVCAGQMEAYPYGSTGNPVSCGYSGAETFPGCGYGFNRRRETHVFSCPAPLPGGGHTTIEHERRTPIAGGNQMRP